jgi:rhomboid protease GluP
MKAVLDRLVDRKGFSLDVFPSYDRELGYFAYRERGGFMKAVIFSREGEEEQQLLSFDEFANFKGVSFDIINLVFAERGYQGSGISRSGYHEGAIDPEGNLRLPDEESLALFTEEKKGTRPLTLRDMAASAPVTMGLIAVNIMIFAASAFLSQSTEINVYVLIYLGAKFNPLMEQGEWWRLVTSAFLHGNLMHILFNMYALYNIGPFLEMRLKWVRFTSIYFISAIMSGLLSFFFTPSVSVGASGAIFGLLGAFLVLALRSKEKVMRRALSNILFIIGINLMIGFAGSGVIDNFGHIGGLLGGIASSLVLAGKGPKASEE